MLFTLTQAQKLLESGSKWASTTPVLMLIRLQLQLLDSIRSSNIYSDCYLLHAIIFFFHERSLSSPTGSVIIDHSYRQKARIYNNKASVSFPRMEMGRVPILELIQRNKIVLGKFKRPTSCLGSNISACLLHVYVELRVRENYVTMHVICCWIII